MLARGKNIRVNQNRLVHALSNNRRQFAAQQKESLDEIKANYANETGSIDGMMI